MPNRARTLGLSLAVLVASCTSMQQQYSVRRTNLSCDDANRYAFQSMRSLGYAVGEFQLASPGRPGSIKGSKLGDRGETRSGAVSIECRSGEVVVSTSDDQLLKQDLGFSRGFYLTFTSLVDHAGESAAWADVKSGGVETGGVKFRVQPQVGLESKLDFGEDLAAGGILAVRVHVQNGSDRTYQFDPASIELRAPEGTEKILQVPIPAAASAIAKSAAADLPAGAPTPEPKKIEELLRGRALTARTLKPKDQLEGFVYFPTGKYARARATLIDTETSEGEGFLIEF